MTELFPMQAQPRPSSPAQPRNPNSFLHDVTVYVGRMREFTREDWLVYAVWIGMMSGLCCTAGGFLLFGSAHGASFPQEAWLVPIGACVFTLAIAIDTIGHRTIYREEISRAEGLVHHVTIACGISSCVLLCMAWQHRGLLWIPALVATIFSFVYSLIDELFHWRRYISANSDRVEMWSHLFILLGHGTMMIGWWRWFYVGYSGVAATMAALRGT